MMDYGSPLKFVSPSGFEEVFRLSVDKVFPDQGRESFGVSEDDCCPRGGRMSGDTA